MFSEPLSSLSTMCGERMNGNMVIDLLLCLASVLFALLAIVVYVIERALFLVVVIAFGIWLALHIEHAYARVVCAGQSTITDDSGPEDARPAVPSACRE